MAEFQPSFHSALGDIYKRKVPFELRYRLGDSCQTFAATPITAHFRPHFCPKRHFLPCSLSSDSRSLLLAVAFLCLTVIELWSNWPPSFPSPSLFSSNLLGFKSITSCSEPQHYNQILQCMPLMWFLKF